LRAASHGLEPLIRGEIPEREQLVGDGLGLGPARELDQNLGQLEARVAAIG
jgi:hypothetical protein